MAIPKIRFKVLTRNRPRPSNAMLADGYIKDAASYSDAAKQLEHFTKKPAPRYFLYCHAIELSLKAYILASGGNEAEVRKIKHDLGKAFSRASELGYRPSLDGTKEVIENLDPYHQDYSFRYMRMGLKILPRFEDIDQVANSMLRDIEPMTLSNSRIQLIKHEAVPQSGSYEVRFPDGRPSQYFYFEDLPGRRLRPDLVDRETALKAAQAYARAEQDNWEESPSFRVK
jgi:hypothetical protein